MEKNNVGRHVVVVIVVIVVGSVRGLIGDGTEDYSFDLKVDLLKMCGGRNVRKVSALNVR